MATVTERERTKKRTSCKMTGVNFAKEGARPENKKGCESSVLDRGGDWEFRVDLDRMLVFPEIVDTTIIPDIVSWSRQAKTTVS